MSTERWERMKQTLEEALRLASEQRSAYLDLARGTGAIATTALAIDPAGDIVGWYTDSDGKTHGYVLSREE